MTVMNAIITRLRLQSDFASKVSLISSPSEIDSSVKRMEICNKIFAMIGKGISNIDIISSASDIDTDLECMKILNRMISSVNSLGKLF